MKQILFVKLAVAVIGAFGQGACATPEDLSTEQKADEARQCWQEIAQAGPGKDFEAYDDTFGYWRDTVISSGHAFWGCYQRHGADVLAKSMTYFGSGTSEQDFRVLYGQPWITLPLNARFETGGWPVEHKMLGISLDKVEFLQLKFAEEQTRMMLSSDVQRHRFYHTVVWATDLGHPAKIDVRSEVLSEHFKPLSKGREYWWYARQFVLLLHATQRTDLLEEVDAENLFRMFQKWKEWHDENERLFVPVSKNHKLKIAENKEEATWEYSRPRSPFPKWNGPKPPRAGRLDIPQVMYWVWPKDLE